MRLVRKGKVKDIYELDDGNILFHFSDRISAFDVKISTPIPRKGEVLCRFGEFWFDILDTPNHMIRASDKDKMIVKKLQMIPVECVVRGYYYGSFVERYKSHLGNEIPSDFKPTLASKLPTPIFDPTTKSEQHDEPIGKRDAVSLGILTEKEYDHIEKISISLYDRMTKIADRAGFIIADVKFEFGRDPNGKIILGDSLGPDEYRLWLKRNYLPGRHQESYDKQLLRDWLIRIGFKDKVDSFAKQGVKPEPPQISVEVVNELSRRYIYAYETISGCKL